MTEWHELEERLTSYRRALNVTSPLLAPWQASRRFPELTYVREDLIGNYKSRKYSSLVPWMVKQGFRSVHLEGSSHSSNILKLSLLLKQHGIHPTYVLEGREGPPVGNGLLNRLVLGSQFLTVAPKNKPDWSVPEGANCEQALAGSLGIAGSLVELALKHRKWPSQIYIDAGTGFTAIALILGLGYFGLPCQVHVVSMTGQSQAEFDGQLARFRPQCQHLLGQADPISYRLHHPSVGQSFGSTPSRVFQEIQLLAQEESLLVDPLYTAKLSLFYEQKRDPELPALMFVSGGSEGLLGFQGPLRKWLEAQNRA